jgi:hypothetical protein
MTVKKWIAAERRNTGQGAIASWPFTYIYQMHAKHSQGKHPAFFGIICDRGQLTARIKAVKMTVCRNNGETM